jgi:hypothetical protein
MFQCSPSVFASYLGNIRKERERVLLLGSQCEKDRPCALVVVDECERASRWLVGSKVRASGSEYRSQRGVLRGGMRSEAREARWERVAVAVGRSVKAWSSREREMRKRVGEWCQRSELARARNIIRRGGKRFISSLICNSSPALPSASSYIPSESASINQSNFSSESLKCHSAKNKG